MSDYTAILSGQSWNSLSSLQESRTPVFLTYTFNPPRSSSLWDWSKFDSADQKLARKALKMWDEASGIRFIEVKGRDAELKFQWQETWTNTTAWAEFPELNRGGFGVREDRIRDSSGGNIYLNTLARPELSQNENYKLYVLLHEIGHALGLKHPFHKMDHNRQLLPSDLDKVENTVMSYTGGDTDMGPVTLGKLDAQAVRALYGNPLDDGIQVAKWVWSQSKQILTQTSKNKADTIYGVAVKDIAKGGNGNDKLYGFDGNDILHGGRGSDLLSGGSGDDQFVFDTRLNPASNFDRILDFDNSWDSDKIYLSSKIFGALDRGPLKQDAFVDGPSAKDENDRIIFDNVGERVAYYDPDGSGPSAALRFAKILGTATIGAADFHIV